MMAYESQKKEVQYVKNNTNTHMEFSTVYNVIKWQKISHLIFKFETC